MTQVPNPDHSLSGDPAAADRRNVKRLVASELRSSVQQLTGLFRILMVFCAVIIADQIYLAVQDRAYVTRAVFFVVVTLMALFQISRFSGSVERYKRGESEGSLIGIISELRNFILMFTFFMLVLSVFLFIKAF